MIWVPRRDDIAENKDAPGVTNLLEQADKREPYTWFPMPIYTLTEVPCKDCDGKGYFLPCRSCKGSGYIGKNDRDCPVCDTLGKKPTLLAKHKDATACEDCNGTGRGIPEGYGIIEFEKIQIGLDGRFLELIKDLPNIQIGVATKADGATPVRFKFDGGEGLLMPLRI